MWCDFTIEKNPLLLEPRQLHFCVIERELRSNDVHFMRRILTKCVIYDNGAGYKLLLCRALSRFWLRWIEGCEMTNTPKGRGIRKGQGISQWCIKPNL